MNAAGSCVDNGCVELKLDFSGVVSHLNSEPAITMELPDSSEPSVPTSHRKRKRVDYAEMDDIVVFCDDTSIGPDCTVSDHDYVTKKPKLAHVVKEKSAAAEVISTATVTEATSRPTIKPEPEIKYRERRDKNNVASRRSRQIRKNKFVEMDKDAEVLEVRNEELRKKIVELEAMAKTMKAMLIKKMTDK